MADVSPLLDYVARQMELTKEEQDIFASLLNIKKLKRKQFVCQPGFVSKHRNYVVKGALRAYVIGSDGLEHTISLAIEDWFIGDAGSYISQEPGTLFVEALENATLIQISYENELLLLEKIPKFHSYFRIRAQRTAVNIQKRVLSGVPLENPQQQDQYQE